MRRAFRARVLNSRQVESDNGSLQGEATILVAAFDKPDTEIAVGLDERQVIDRGAFQAIAENRDLTTDPIKGFLDHGDAHLNGGFFTSDKLIGKAVGMRETADGLELDTRYNLRTPQGSMAWEQLMFDKEGTVYSFSWPSGEKTIPASKSADGFAHVTEFPDLTEWSQVPFAAQAATGVIEARAKETLEMALTLEEDRRKREQEQFAAGANAKPEPKTTTPDELLDRVSEAIKPILADVSAGRRMPEDDELKEWIQDGSFRKRLKGVLEETVEPSKTVAPSDPAATQTSRAYSLDDIQWTVRKAYMAAHPSQPGEMEMGSWCEEVWAEDGTLDAGFVIVSAQEGYSQVPWSRDVEGAVTFADDQAKPVEKEWTVAGAPIRSMLNDPKFRESWEAVKELPTDPVQGFYELLFNEEKVATG